MNKSIKATIGILTLAILATMPVTSEQPQPSLGTIQDKLFETYSKIHDMAAELTAFKNSANTELTAIKGLTYGKSDFKTKWNADHQASDQKARQEWSILITKAASRFARRPEKFKKTLKNVLSARISTLSGLGEGTQGSSLREMLTNLVKVSLEVTDAELQKVPSQASYENFRMLVNNLNSVTNQRILESELDENEETIDKNEVARKKSGNKAITWSYVTVIFVLAVLVILILGFGMWFCYVCKRNRADAEATIRRAEIRNRRDTEGRIGVAVAHELQPFVQLPTAPPGLPPPLAYRQ